MFYDGSFLFQYLFYLLESVDGGKISNVDEMLASTLVNNAPKE